VNLNMTGIDVAIVILTLLSAIVGLVRGLVREVLSLVVWAAALVLALLFTPLVAELLAPLIATPSLRYVTGFAGVFIGTLIVGGIVESLMSRLIDGTGMTGTDRLLGFLFGGARGVLVCIVALIALRPFGEQETWWQDSLVVPELMAFEGEILAFLDAAVDLAGDLVSKT
jgi:membrane protein required for colicin V production